MRITVKVRAGKGNPEVSGVNITIYTRERRENNQANLDVIRQLSRLFGIPTARIRLVSGRTSRTKVFDLME